MNIKTDSPGHDAELRARAERLARLHLAQAGVDQQASSTGDMQVILHDLRVHQIELEMQNEELRRAQVELSLARARYFDLYDFAPIGYCTLSEQGFIRQANLAAATLLGVPRAELVDRPFTQFIAKADQDIYYLQRRQLIASGQAMSCELRMVKANGVEFWGQLESTATLDADGVTEFRTVLSDATERKRKDVELILARRIAEKANLAKSHFLAAASHDLRQPLTAMSIYAKVLLDHVAPSGRRLLVNMLDCIGSLGSLLNDLLDISKLEAGAVKANCTSFPVADVLASLESVHAPAARQKGLRLRYVPSDLTAHTDPVLFNRIVGNLIENGIRYTERGGVLVACRRHRGKTWVEVRDTGIGIPPDKTEEIFDEFKQLGDEARTRGSGLGLAIVAKTAALLGLEIRVWSRLGRGSLFAVELPLGQLAAIPVPAPRATQSRTRRIGLVEDNALVRDAFELGLRRAGHQVVSAACARELCTKLGNLAPDIVMSDYSLQQGETGLDVITAVRAVAGADLPAIIVTGDTDPMLMHAMADHNIVVLHKPVDLESLLASVEDLTGAAT